ncbi:uracil DNA glycosylase [Trichuris trichiura]|uniref:Uracil-DNA glycosylase n=1 Tax=Trichuris trichiura TaxID=36087 RepID=A0A077ZD33_TRITR|nr:uracil DNA glycosylase [Trichuris trichiura]
MSREVKRTCKTGTEVPSKQKRLDMFVAVTVENKEAKYVIPEDSLLAPLLHEDSWRCRLSSEFSKPYFKEIENFLAAAWKQGKVIFPERRNIFAALNLTPLNQVKVVLIGQDPYHNPGQASDSSMVDQAFAHGLCFSVQPGVPKPPSLQNIFKELETDISGFKTPNHGCLTSWAKEGVLLLNATLTVEKNQPNSHASIGWQTFTDRVIKTVNDHCYGVVFMLWGAFAQKKEKLVSAEKHIVIKAAHPSPLSQSRFFGCKCFSKANEALKEYGKNPINWDLN